MALKKTTQIATIDVNLVTLKATVDTVVTEIAIDTANKIAVTPSIETKDAVKLVVKNVLKAQKPAQSVITGNTIVLTDNVFSPELVHILQGGTITYDATDTTKVIGYKPPIAGSAESVTIFELCAYSAQYNTAGTIVQYEKITYPNCQGVPVAFSSEDGVFRVSEYTINSAPNTGEAPYSIDYVATLPAIA
jgi:hypothetical protein